MSLRLTHLKVDQLRRFRQPFELPPLQPGLNIFTGPNEAGKSTLVRAIRAAFFERYRSKSVDDLRPWGDSGASPSVEIGFEIDGQPGQLSKSFLGSKARCDLRIGGQTWSGSDAEDHLAQLMGFHFAGKGASKSEHWGIPGLLWVEQGSGQDLKEAAEYAHAHLHHALQSHLRGDETAALTATGGDAILGAILNQRDQLLTSTGRPKGVYADAIARVEQAAHRCEALQAKVLAYQQQVDDLARLRAAHLREEHDRPWDALQAQLNVAEKVKQDAEQAQGQLAQARMQLDQLQAQHGLLKQQLANHAQRERDRELREQQAEQAKAALHEVQVRLSLVQQQAEQSQSDLTKAQTQLRVAQQASQRQQWLKQSASQAQAIEDAKAVLQQAMQAQSTLQALRQPMGGVQLTSNDVQRLRQWERQAHEARLRTQDQATRLRFSLAPGQAIALQGQGQNETLSGDGTRLLLGSTTLQLPGLGELRIEPASKDLGELAQQQHMAEQGLAEALLALRLSDLASAEQRFEQQSDLIQKIKLAEQALSLHAPKGVEALRADLDLKASEHQQTEEALQRLPTAPEEPSGLSVAEAEAALSSAQSRQMQTSRALADVQAERASVSALAEAAEREWAAIERQVTEPEAIQRHAEAVTQSQIIHAQMDVQQQCVALLEEQVQWVRPDILQQDVMRLERSLAQSRQAHQSRHTDLAVLEQTLAQQGAQGLEEQLTLSQGERCRAERRQAELALRAQALELLREKLEAKRQAALQKLQAPLQKHLQRYLGLLFNGALVTVSDTLVPTDLSRRNAAGAQEMGAFEALSFGAREQLALVSRFAYADLLREAGRPTLIILDDALVHSDAERFAMMKRIVFDASQRHQVLLFSCHQSFWMDMGVLSIDICC